jgi:hypothetical protein
MCSDGDQSDAVRRNAGVSRCHVILISSEASAVFVLHVHEDLMDSPTFQLQKRRNGPSSCGHRGRLQRQRLRCGMLVRRLAM